MVCDLWKIILIVGFQFLGVKPKMFGVKPQSFGVKPEGFGV
jgi:hypothetical protein